MGVKRAPSVALLPYGCEQRTMPGSTLYCHMGVKRAPSVVLLLYGCEVRAKPGLTIHKVEPIPLSLMKRVVLICPTLVA
jgi:hypothetical protein